MKRPEGEEVGPVFITKYALTTGILRFERGVISPSGSMVSVRSGRTAYGGHMYFHGKDFHQTEEAARERMFEMLAKKIQSTEKTLAKLKKVDPLSVPIVESK